MKGGRLVDVYKGKGDKRVCDNSRGLTIMSHPAKMMLQPVKDVAEPFYLAGVPKSQYGATRGGGTDFGHHVVLEAIAYAASVGLSIFVLFLDLVKAFDLVLRELVFGFPPHVDEDNASKLAYLAGIGIEREDAQWIIDTIATEGCAFDRFGVDRGTRDIINEAHSMSWSRYGTSDTVIVQKRGGRQGCKLGALVFNSAYALALRVVQRMLAREGITLRLPSVQGPFWHESYEPGRTSEE